jgi:hypothetical protein
VSHLLLGVWIWIGGMPIAGLVLLNLLRREPTEKNTLGPRSLKKYRKTWEETPPEVDSVIAVVGAIFWPGTVVLVGLAILVGFILIRLMVGPVTEAHEAGYKLEYIQGKMLWRCLECERTSGHSETCSKAAGGTT